MKLNPNSSLHLLFYYLITLCVLNESKCLLVHSLLLQLVLFPLFLRCSLVLLSFLLGFLLSQPLGIFLSLQAQTGVHNIFNRSKLHLFLFVGSFLRLTLTWSHVGPHNLFTTKALIR